MASPDKSGICSRSPRRFPDDRDAAGKKRRRALLLTGAEAESQGELIQSLQHTMIGRLLRAGHFTVIIWFHGGTSFSVMDRQRNRLRISVCLSLSYHVAVNLCNPPNLCWIFTGKGFILCVTSSAWQQDIRYWHHCRICGMNNTQNGGCNT